MTSNSPGNPYLPFCREYSASSAVFLMLRSLSSKPNLGALNNSNSPPKIPLLTLLQEVLRELGGVGVGVSLADAYQPIQLQRAARGLGCTAGTA